MYLEKTSTLNTDRERSKIVKAVLRHMFEARTLADCTDDEEERDMLNAKIRNLGIIVLAVTASITGGLVLGG